MGNIKLGFLNETKKWGEISVLVKVLKRIGENFFKPMLIYRICLHFASLISIDLILVCVSFDWKYVK